MPIILWTSFFISTIYRSAVDGNPAHSFSHYSPGAGKQIGVSPSQILRAGWSVAPYLCPIFLLYLVDGLPFGFQQGIWFPQNGPKRTEDSASLAELHQALAVMEDLIKSCELAVDLAAVTGCPVRYVP